VGPNWHLLDPSIRQDASEVLIQMIREHWERHFAQYHQEVFDE
jgi:hypothetical protein